MYKSIAVPGIKGPRIGDGMEQLAWRKSHIEENVQGRRGSTNFTGLDLWSSEHSYLLTNLLI
jgi:hypothetical protein